MKKIIVIFVGVIILIFVTLFNSEPKYGKEELIDTIVSPNQKIVLNIYQGPPLDSVMVDYYVVGEIEYQKKLFLKNKTAKEVIYYKYHEEFDNAYWEDNNTIVLNEHTINIKDKKTWIYD